MPFRALMQTHWCPPLLDVLRPHCGPGPRPVGAENVDLTLRTSFGYLPRRRPLGPSGSGGFLLVYVTVTVPDRTLPLGRLSARRPLVCNRGCRTTKRWRLGPARVPAAPGAFDATD